MPILTVLRRTQLCPVKPLRPRKAMRSERAFCFRFGTLLELSLEPKWLEPKWEDGINAELASACEVGRKSCSGLSCLTICACAVRNPSVKPPSVPLSSVTSCRDPEIELTSSCCFFDIVFSRQTTGRTFCQ